MGFFIMVNDFSLEIKVFMKIVVYLVWNVENRG